MLRLCIFDLDGTLINSLNDLAAAMNHALAENGLEVYAPEKYRLMVGSGISVLADRAMGKAAGDAALKDSVLADFSRYYTDHCLDLTQPYPDIPQLLSELRQNNIMFAVNSNKPEPFSRMIIESLFPGTYFAAIVGKRDDIRRKPAPDGVLEIISKTGVTKDECIYIGDSNVDAFTAQNSGIAFCGVSWGFRSSEELRAAGAGFIADAPADILTYIKTLSGI